MHSSMLAPGLLALVSASAVATQTCGNNFLSIGNECASGMSEGDRVCDSTYRNILICHDGKMQLSNPCAPGHCVWKEDTKSAFCSGYQDDSDSDSDSDDEDDDNEDDDIHVWSPNCGLVQQVGQNCSRLIKEGAELCDKNCQNLLICRNGTMKLSKACGGKSSCKADEDKELGKGSACRTKKPPRKADHVFLEDVPVQRCGPSGQIGDSCGKLIKEGWHVCDPSCDNIVRCRDGKIEQAQHCGQGLCDSMLSKPFGQAAFCRLLSSSTDSTRLSDPTCYAAWAAAEFAYGTYRGILAAYCEDNRSVGRAAALDAYKKGMETSRKIREVCPDNEDRKLLFDPDDDKFEAFDNDFSGCTRRDDGDNIKISAAHAREDHTLPDCVEKQEILERLEGIVRNDIETYSEHHSKKNLNKAVKSYKKWIVFYAFFKDCPGFSFADDIDITSNIKGTDRVQRGDHILPECIEKQDALKGLYSAFLEKSEAYYMDQSKKSLNKAIESFKKMLLSFVSFQEDCPEFFDDIDIEGTDGVQCGPSQHTPGDPCFQEFEGQTRCDVSCTRILICHDHTWQVNNECPAPGSCTFVYDSNAAYCV